MIENIQNEDVKNELEKKFNDIKNYLRSVFQLSNDIEFSFDIEINKGKLEIIVGISNPNHDLEYKIQDITPSSIKIDYLLKVIFKNISFDCSKHLIKRYIALFSNAFIEIDKSVLENDNYSDFINIFTSLSFEKCNFYIHDRTTLDGFNFFNDLTFIDCFFNNKLLIGECVFEKKFIFETRKNQKHELFVMDTHFKDSCEIILNTDEDTLELLKVQFDKEFDCIKCNLHNIKSIFFNEVVFEDYFYVARRIGIKSVKELLLDTDFKTEIDIKNTIFKKETDFSRTKFEKNVKLHSLIFYEKVIFGSYVTLKSGMNEILKIDNITFLSDVDFSNVSFEKIKLKIKNSIFSKDFSLIKSHVKGCGVNVFNKKITIYNSQFDGLVNLSRCNFKDNIKIIKCEFNKQVQCCQSLFEKKFDFSDNNVNRDIHFDKSEFKEEVVFDYTIFNDILSLLFVIFHKAPKFALVKFANSANIQTFNLRIGESNEELNEDCYRKENIESKLNELKARTDTFRLIKDQAIKNNDLLVATEQKKLELYARELELDYCKKINGVKYTSSMYQKTASESAKLTIIEVFDRLFLKLNRTTSDHHTDFLKILLFTLSVIGGYFMINFGLSFDEKIISSICNLVDLGLAMYGVSVVIFLLCLGYEFLFVLKGFSKDKGWLIFIFLAICVAWFCLAYSFNVSEFSVILPMIFIGILAMLFILLANNVKYTFISFAAAGFIGILCTPNIITPFLGAFSEDARNHYLYKAIDELDSQKALDLSKQILAKEPTSELNAKKILKDYKDELKSSKLLDESPELKRAIAIDGGVSRLNIAYYLVLAFCIFALQKTMRKNSIIPS